jgi:siroheme synthase (precorrin-2 oxidase/ferrochelatase)
MQAIVKAGPVRVAISTGGIAPRVGGKLRAALQQTFDATFVRFIDCINAQRERNRLVYSESKDRRAAMMRTAEGFEVEVSVRYPQWFEDELAAQRPLVLPSAEG